MQRALPLLLLSGLAFADATPPPERPAWLSDCSATLERARVELAKLDSRFAIAQVIADEAHLQVCLHRPLGRESSGFHACLDATVEDDAQPIEPWHALPNKSKWRDERWRRHEPGRTASIWTEESMGEHAAKFVDRMRPALDRCVEQATCRRRSCRSGPAGR
jgi:hypothetical protein